MLKQLLQTYNLSANETLTLQDFKMPDVPDDSDINFIIHEKQGHSHVTLLNETDGPPPWFYIGVDDLEDRTARSANRPGSSSDRSPVFRIVRDAPTKLSAAVSLQPPESVPSASRTSASKGKGKAKLVLPEDALMDWCKTFSAKAKRKRPPKSFSNHWNKTSEEFPTPKKPFHWAASKSSAPVSRDTSVSKGKGKAKEVHWQPSGRTQAVPQKTWPPEDNEKDEETQRLGAWQDWWKEIGHELPEGGSAKFHCRPCGLESALSFYEKLSALRVHGEDVQGAASSADPQASPAVDNGKGKEAQRLPPSKPTPFVSQEASTPQDKVQGLPPLGTLGLPAGDSRPRPPTIGQRTWEDNSQGFPRVHPPVTLLPPVLVDNSRDRLYGPTLGLPTSDGNGRGLQQPATMLPPLLGDNAQGLTRLAPLALPTSQGNSQGLPSPTDRGEGFQGGSFSVTPQTSTSEDKDRGGQHESSSATSQTPSSKGKGR
jgi:hypothetical protein